MSDPLHDQTRCTARRRNGTPCNNRPIRGGTVCRMHGGSAPQVKRAAQVRLDMAADRAAAVMVRIMEDDAAPTADRIRAAAQVLDRAGMRTGIDVNVSGGLTWEQKLDSMLVDVGVLYDLDDVEDAEVVGPVEIEAARQEDEKTARIAKRTATQGRLDEMRAANRPSAPRPRYDS
jgi:hypothetical protein